MSDYEQGFDFSEPQFLHPFSEGINQTVYKALFRFFQAYNTKNKFCLHLRFSNFPGPDPESKNM